MVLKTHALSTTFCPPARENSARSTLGRAATVIFVRAALDSALDRLATFDARKSQVVELRFFGGLDVEQTAASLGVSPQTVMRDWRLAKVWLFRELGGGGSHGA